MKHVMRWVAPLLLALPLGIACSSTDPENDPAEPTDDESRLRNEIFEENASGKADNADCSGVVLPDQSGFNKRVAITFDDGPHLDNTPRVLDVLAAHHATATFFINGKGVRTAQHRDLLKRMHEAGHIIGNHSQNHANLKTVSAATLKAEIEGTHQILLDVGVKPAFFRFPYGSSSCATAETVRSYGYAVTGWHIDSADWCFAASRGGVGYCDPATFQHVPNSYRSDIAGFVLSQARAKGGGVLLFHDVHAYTVGVLDSILTKLENDGFRFVGLDDVDTFPRLNGKKPASSPFIGSACEDHDDCNFTAVNEAGFCQTYEGGGFCSISCNGTCPDKAGMAPTFCVSLDGNSGQCVAKSSAANGYCADLPGTTAKPMSRFIGTSSAPASTADVCVP
ncbi:MAG TPA: polysaccharide deacetylase family protein [Polyangiaceae bacterium]|jgi:peptidoglycan/xylan/chitin deacetylase (PgdA/CDA1 family)|nr:MAG: Peptidoglycan-N-acetylglucosamine deacetylase [Deltaproteobacteria bacterium ADurb.Bin207]HNZ22381.1 polysaccharide deacetylase family protein [Polyangiaceae bacterium]HOD20915.1 polysaccharide deacetylase family protein [Polyangiaceae bacterium]HOE48274.1 polysaccharide deacetylase family protein [Polyangiaceae bacterium]HOH00050.1 polysaccharide deacetylase family protein [Polyangiaceae bacterium]